MVYFISQRGNYSTIVETLLSEPPLRLVLKQNSLVSMTHSISFFSAPNEKRDKKEIEWVKRDFIIEKQIVRHFV